ncbi:unnamed protein product [marine sediment metagenome]|uniref:Uncharacterized protein n=1 Tax=marine sediment metagenome TaxID=412755 RepID=X1A0L4_9ZZZZ
MDPNPCIGFMSLPELLRLEDEGEDKNLGILNQKYDILLWINESSIDLSSSDIGAVA